MVGSGARQTMPLLQRQDSQQREDSTSQSTALQNMYLKDDQQYELLQPLGPLVSPPQDGELNPLEHTKASQHEEVKQLHNSINECLHETHPATTHQRDCSSQDIDLHNDTHTPSIDTQQSKQEIVKGIGTTDTSLESIQPHLQPSRDQGTKTATVQPGHSNQLQQLEAIAATRGKRPQDQGLDLQEPEQNRKGHDKMSTRDTEVAAAKGRTRTRDTVKDLQKQVMHIVRLPAVTKNELGTCHKQVGCVKAL